MKTFFAVFFAFTFFCSPIVLSQNDTVFSPVTINKQYLLSYFGGTADILISPIKWKPKQWVTAAVLSATTIAIYSYADTPIRDVFQDNSSRNQLFDNVSEFGNFYGSEIFTFSVTGGLILTGFASRNKRIKRLGLLSLQAVIISGGASQFCKHLFGRYRPYTLNGHDRWEGISFKSDYASFYSGHTSVAFALATVFAHEFKDRKFVPYLTYGLASITGLSRIYSDKHWASDVVTGAILSTFFTKMLLKRSNRENNRYVFSPQISNFYKGLSLSVSF